MNSSLTKSHFPLVKLYIVNHKEEKSAKSHNILAQLIVLDRSVVL